MAMRRSSISSARCRERGVKTKGSAVDMEVRPSGPAGGPMRVLPLLVVLLVRLWVLMDVVDVRALSLGLSEESGGMPTTAGMIGAPGTTSADRGSIWTEPGPLAGTVGAAATDGAAADAAGAWPLLFLPLPGDAATIGGAGSAWMAMRTSDMS